MLYPTENATTLATVDVYCRHPMPDRLILHQRLSPGDAVVLTALVRDLALTYPDRYAVAVDTPYPGIWESNPHIVAHGIPAGWEDVPVLTPTYSAGIERQKHEQVHFLSWMHRDFERQTGVAVPLTKPTPDLHAPAFPFLPAEGPPYWVVVAGGKFDATTKVWDADRFQRVIDLLVPRGYRFVQAGRRGPKEWHPKLQRVTDLVNKSNLRQFIRLIACSQGVLCGVTCAMHIAAAYQKPCVVLAGGREAWWWEGYVRENAGLPGAEQLAVPHRYMHTIGRLDCCAHHGCWKQHVIPFDDGAKPDRLCKQPVAVRRQTIPACLEMISVEQVVAAIRSYDPWTAANPSLSSTTALQATPSS